MMNKKLPSLICQIGLPLLLIITSMALTPHVVLAKEVTFYAVGDVMLGRNIGKYIESRGKVFPFMHTMIDFRKSDLVFGNLESVLGDEKDKLHFPEKPYNFKAPLDMAKALKTSGINVLSLANNHTLDYGPKAVIKTRTALQQAGIATFGAGKNLEEARNPAIVTSKGMKFGFLGYGNGHSRRMYATEKKTGVAPVHLEQVIRDIEVLQCKVDFLVVSLHWGIEYERMPTKKQRKIARQLIDAGADMILGHHPHVYQGIELYKERIIAYSLGNFLFDQKHKGTDQSVMLYCKFRNRDLKSVEVVPLDRYRSFFPKRARGKVKDDILDRLRTISAPLNSDPKALKKIGL